MLQRCVEKAKISILHVNHIKKNGFEDIGEIEVVSVDRLIEAIESEREEEPREDFSNVSGGEGIKRILNNL